MGKVQKSAKYLNDGNPSVSKFENKTGLNISTYAWRASSPTAAIIGIHGIQTHCRMEYLSHSQFEKPAKSLVKIDTETSASEISDWCVYKGSWVEYFNNRNVSFYGLDLQSHGLSDGWKKYRCNVERFDDFADDIIQYLEIVCAEIDQENKKNSKAPIPVFLMGISMGGCVVLRALQKMSKDGNPLLHRTDGCRLEGLIALAPMLSVEKITSKPINRILLPISSLVSAMAPNMPITNVEANEKNVWVDDRKAEDPLVSYPSKIPVRLSVESLSAIVNAQAEGKFIPENFPIMFVHSEADTMVEIEGTDKFLNHSASHLKNTHFMRLKDMWHYLVVEPGNEKIVTEIFDWMEKQQKTRESSLKDDVTLDNAESKELTSENNEEKGPETVEDESLGRNDVDGGSETSKL